MADDVFRTAVLSLIGNTHDGWMTSFYAVSRSINAAVADGRIGEDMIRAYRPYQDVEGAAGQLAALADVPHGWDVWRTEDIDVSVEALHALITFGDSEHLEDVWGWLDNTAELTEKGLTVDSLGAFLRSLTVREAATLVQDADNYIREGK